LANEINCSWSLSCGIGLLDLIAAKMT